jgi:hypothetical protein
MEDLVRNFLLRHIFAVQLVLGAVLGAAGAAAGLSRAVTVSVLALAAGLAAIWMQRSPLPPPSKQKLLRASQHLRKPRAAYVSPYVVRFSDEGVVVTIGDKKSESVLWADLVMVAITIEDCFLPEPFWILFGRPGKGGCLYPNQAVGAGAMLGELQTRLPGFDNLAVAKAMGMMAGGVQVWKHPEWKD